MHVAPASAQSFEHLAVWQAGKLFTILKLSNQGSVSILPEATKRGTPMENL